MIIRAIPDNHIARQRVLCILQLRIARKRDCFIRHRTLHLIMIDHFVAGRMDGLSFFVRRINDDVRLGDNVIYVSA